MSEYLKEKLLLEQQSSSSSSSSSSDSNIDNPNSTTTTTASTTAIDLNMNINHRKLGQQIHHHHHQHKKEKNHNNIPERPITVLLDLPHKPHYYHHLKPFPHIYHNSTLYNITYTTQKQVTTTTTATTDIQTLSKNPPIRHEKYGYVIELSEFVLHPLIDASNSKLYSFCHTVDYLTTKSNHNNNNHDEHSKNSENLHLRLTKENLDKLPKLEKDKIHLEKNIQNFLKSDSGVDVHYLCQQISKSDFFIPDRIDTIAVHMWSHVYLGWNFIRSYLNFRTYRSVENILPPTLSCLHEF